MDSWNLHRRHLTAEFRRERVADLKRSGLSQNAIAEKLGVSQKTVWNDIQKAKAAGNDLSLPAPPAPAPAAPALDPPAPRPAPAPPPAPPKVTGRDGKQYR